MEKLLDQGVIAIVPVLREITTPTSWRCVVLDDSKNGDTVLAWPGTECTRVKVSLLYNYDKGRLMIM